MKATSKTFEELTSGAADFLIKELSRAPGTAHHYHCLWRRIKKYMDVRHKQHFDQSVGKEYLLHEFGDRDYNTLTKREKDLVKAVNVLSEFQKKGFIQPLKEQPFFEGEIGRAITEYLSYRISLRLKKHTIEEGEQHLYRFFQYLDTHKVTSVKAINQVHILKFIKTINPKFPSLTHRTIESIRGFLKYAYEQNLLEYNLASIVPKDNYKKQPRLPSTYSSNEIEMMISAIDRGNSVGKRNYAIVLLAARLGLRASDISNLKFDNLFWAQSLIILNQYKTGKKIELPILADVGNAIIDYLKYGRPKSTEPFVFLLARSPYTPIISSAVTGIVHSYFVKSGINISGRRHGPHALRHSLAGILLEKETILPVISEVLGHKNTASTNYYLRIDLQSMRKCTLEVPPVSESFYIQKGGYFYV